MFRKTKIVCTLGPSVASYDAICSLIDSGMNVARINCSHGTIQEQMTFIQLVKKAREEKGACVAIMLDTKGPEIRLGKIEGDAMSVSADQEVCITHECKSKTLSIRPAEVLEHLRIGDRVLFDDGYIGSYVVRKEGNAIWVKIENGGVLKSYKGVNIPAHNMILPAMTLEDREVIALGCREGVDIIAASFVRLKDHVEEIKHFLSEIDCAHVCVIAKIEDRHGVMHFDDILDVADGIMVARGDLGVEVPLHEVPSLQKMMIRKCYSRAKPVITATQMLESMTYNPRPTRAEVSDVANAIYDSTSAVMLSGETAIGLYPIIVVDMMRQIIEEAEKQFPYKDFFSAHMEYEFRDPAFSVAQSAVKTSYTVRAHSIFAFTTSGFTARMLSRFRPEVPIFAFTPSLEVYYKLALIWGVVPMKPCAASSIEEALSIATEYVKSRGWVQPGDCVLITAGAPFGVCGTTNTLIVETVK